MLKRRTWPAYTASLAAATLIGGAGLAGASAASAVSQAAPAPAGMTPIGTVPGIPPGARISGPEYDIRRPLTPTGTNLLGLVKHVASVEPRPTGTAAAPAGHDVPHAMAVAGTSRNAPVSY